MPSQGLSMFIAGPNRCFPRCIRTAHSLTLQPGEEREQKRKSGKNKWEEKRRKKRVTRKTRKIQEKINRIYLVHQSYLLYNVLHILHRCDGASNRGIKCAIIMRLLVHPYTCTRTPTQSIHHTSYIGQPTNSSTMA